MSQICSQCNAPLPLGPAGSVATCTYCGTDTHIVGQTSPGIIVINDPTLRARLNNEMAERAAEEDAKKSAEQLFARKAGLAFILILILIIACRALLGSP